MEKPRGFYFAKQPIHPFLLVLFLLAVIFRVWVAAPTWIHVDENCYLDIAQNFLDRGQLSPHMWRLENLNIISGGGSGYGLLILISWQSLVKNSLFGGRLFMALIGLLSALIMYPIAVRWWHSRTAGLAALVFGLTGTAPFYSLILKMDALAVFAYCLSLLLFVYSLEHDRWWLHFTLGAAMVLILEVHVLGALYLAAFSLYYLVQFLARVRKIRRIPFHDGAIFFAAGALIALVVYAIVHILPDPRAAFYISKACFECNESIFVTEGKRVIRLLYTRPHEVLLFLLVAGAAVKRRDREDRAYLILLAGYILAQAVTHTPPYDHYANHFWPLLALGIGGLVARGFNGLENRNRPRAAAAVAMILLVANLGMHLAGYHPYMLAATLQSSSEIAYINNNIPRNAVVMAHGANYGELLDFHNFLAYREGTAYGTSLRGETMLDFWRKEHPTVIYISENEYTQDAELRQYIDESGFTRVMPRLWVIQ